MVGSLVYSRSISSKDFLTELNNVFNKLHHNTQDSCENKYLKPVILNPAQIMGLSNISLEEVLANSAFELINSLAPYERIIGELDFILKQITNQDISEQDAKEIEVNFLSCLLDNFNTLVQMDAKDTATQKHEKLKSIKIATNHLFRYLGASNQPIINIKKLSENDYKNAEYYQQKHGSKTSPVKLTDIDRKLSENEQETYRLNLSDDMSTTDLVNEIIPNDGENQTEQTFSYSYYQNQVNKLINDSIAYYMSFVISFGEGSNAWRGLYIFLSSTIIAASSWQSAVVLSLPLLAGYCSQQVNQVLFYQSIRDSFNKFSKGLFKMSNGEEITRYSDLALLGGALSISLCAAFALTAILQFSSTLTLFNLLFSSLPTAISMFLPEMLPTILSATIAAFSFVGFSSIFSLSFIEKTKSYIESKNAEEEKITIDADNNDSMIAKIISLFVTGCAISAHTFQCITAVDQLPGIKEHAILCKSLILIAEIPFTTFLYNGISSFINKLINAFSSQVHENHSDDDAPQTSPIYNKIKENNDYNRAVLSTELPLNSVANSLVFKDGISNNLSTMFPTLNPVIVTGLSLAGGLSIFAGSYGNNDSAIQATTETCRAIKPKKLAAL